MTKSCLVILASFLVSCSTPPVGTPLTVTPPLGLPHISIPVDNLLTYEKVALGRQLFFEKNLSADNTIACASCHNPAKGFADGLAHSVGFAGKLGTRNAPTILNAAYNKLQFWDGRAAGLEPQALIPIANPSEMNMPHGLCVDKLGNISSYKSLFDKAFGPGPITIAKVTMAIASYERTLLSGGSPFDQYRYGANPSALTPAAIRGLAVFTDRKCITCHSMGDQSALFTDGKFHNIGIGIDSSGELVDLGRYSETKLESDRGAFKTPSLRNVALTAPYMHDGSLKTLPDVIAFYAGGGNSNPNLDKEIKPLNLSPTDRADLLEFLNSLTGHRID